MKFFIIEGIFIEPCPVGKEALEKSIREHVAYLDKGFESGAILVTGPKAGGGGGFLLMKAESEDEVFDFFEQDPMKVLGVQNYIVSEFNIHKNHPLASGWFTA
jgi:uncharacterized protein YciI